MATDRSSPSRPEDDFPESRGQVRPLRSEEVGRTLTARMGPIIDRLRQLHTSFGLRPYRVFLVHVAWSGSRRGDGGATEISRREILPTPLVIDMSSVNEIIRATGNTEEGGIKIVEISSKYSQDDLMGVTLDLQDPALLLTGKRNVEFFWEVVENRPRNPKPSRRRFVPNAAPELSRDTFDWRVNLTRQAGEGNRDTGALIPRDKF